MPHAKEHSICITSSNLLLLLFIVVFLGLPSPTASVCPNNCSGHGRCENFTCDCTQPYTSDDCSHGPPNGDFALPLTAGHANATSSKQFKALMRKHSKTLIGFSSPTSICHVCSFFEHVYVEVFEYIQASHPDVKFLRVNAHSKVRA